MADLFKNARSALHDFFQGRRSDNTPDQSAAAASAPGETPSPLAAEIGAALDARDGSKVLQLLRPRPGLASALRELQRNGRLASVFPERSLAHAIAAIERLEQLDAQTSVNSERFGTMLRELEAPALLSLAFLVHDSSSALDALAVAGDERRNVEFLIANQLQMSMMAFRQDTSDPSVIGKFAELFSTEERLKMLCLLTVADLSAVSADALTPWKAEVLWRLFVDTYNHMTMTYGDEVIDRHETAMAALAANRPHDISDQELTNFLTGLPRRYLTLFEPERIYRHVRLARDITADDVHFFLNKKSDVWDLTVVTLDKPYLFSNICGVVSYLGFDILRGNAFTSRTGLIVDVVQFTDRKGCLVRPQLDPLLSDAVAGRVDISGMLRDKLQKSTAAGATASTVVYFDNDSSPRYTILELVADDAPGLLHRISRVISEYGFGVDLVLISTEGHRAIDVFHLRKGDGKLGEADELALTEAFERMLT